MKTVAEMMISFPRPLAKLNSFVHLYIWTI